MSVTYSLSTVPNVRVLAPALEGRPDESIPHLYSDGSLCLHLAHEWSSSMFIVHTIVPWTSEWLVNYEIWVATGNWNGGGEWPPPRQANSTSFSKKMRPERPARRRRSR